MVNGLRNANGYNPEFRQESPLDIREKSSELFHLMVENKLVSSEGVAKSVSRHVAILLEYIKQNPDISPEDFLIEAIKITDRDELAHFLNENVNEAVMWTLQHLHDKGEITDKSYTIFTKIQERTYGMSQVLYQDRVDNPFKETRPIPLAAATPGSIKPSWFTQSYAQLPINDFKQSLDSVKKA